LQADDIDATFDQEFVFMIKIAHSEIKDAVADQGLAGIYHILLLNLFTKFFNGEHMGGYVRKADYLAPVRLIRSHPVHRIKDEANFIPAVSESTPGTSIWVR
jgi:hypothetical protein